jgi:hypothetical protein
VVVVLALLSLGLADWLRNPQAIQAAVSQAFREDRLGDADGMQRFGPHRISHFSECIGLSTAIAPAADNDLAFTLQSPALLWQPPRPICQSLRDELTAGLQPHFAYSRYWHGYRLVTEPFLSFFSYASLQRWDNVLLLACAFLVLTPFLPAVFSGQASAGRIASLIGAAALLLATTDVTMMGLTPTHTVSFCVLLLCWALALKRPAAADFHAFVPWIFVMGAVYNFFDFLYNPDLLAFVLGWSFFLRAVLAERRALLRSLAEAIVLQGVAIAGYMAMWAAKWGLVLLGGKIFGEQTSVPTQDFGRWLGGGDLAYVPFRALYSLLVESATMPLGWIPLAACAAAILLLLALSLRNGTAPGVLAVMALTLFPLFVLELKSNHTLQHTPFTFRFLPFALVLTAAGAAAMVSRGRAGITRFAAAKAAPDPS